MSNPKIYTVKIYEDRTEWFNEKDQLHREEGPAIEYADGDKEWYINGKLHRENGPAVEYANGDKCWYLNGKYHREEEFNNRDKCKDKVVEIDGKKYKLISLEE